MAARRNETVRRRAPLALVAALAAAAGALGPALPPAHARVPFAPAALTPTALPAPDELSDRLAEAEAAMLADPAQALVLAEALAEEPLSPPLAARTLWLTAEALVRLNRADEAERPAARALALLPGDAEPKLRGDLSLTQGRIARRQGETDTALARYHAAHELFAEAGEARSQAITLQSIGSIYSDAGAYERVLHYYARADELLGGSDQRLAMVAANNMGNALKALGRHDEAEARFVDALAIAEALGSDYLRVRILTNMASVQTRASRLGDAEATVERALAITRAAGEGGQAWADFVYGVRAELRRAKGLEDGAAADIARVFGGKDLAETSAPYREFHELAAGVLAGTDPAAALAHMQAFVRLDAAARDAAASANLALRAAEFDFAAQDLEIERLETASLRDSLALANAEHERRKWQVIGLLGGLGVIVGASLLAVHFFRRSHGRLRAVHEELAASHDELTTTNAALVEANEARMRFLAATSHEIRTPLNGIIGMTEVILRDMHRDDENRPRVRIAHEAGRALLAIVNDILDMAKIERDETEVQRTEVDLPGLFADTAALWQKAADDKGLRLITSFQGCPQTARIDEKHVRQITNNLVNNAIKFTDAGEVSLVVGVRGDDLVVRVRDTGLGIAEADAERVFGMFEQARAGQQRRYGGTGLGLAICRRLARLMGGEITLESAVGAGSTFTLTVPLTDAGAAAGTTGAVLTDAALPPMSLADTLAGEASELLPPAEPPQSFQLSSLRVLVAEDNAVNQMVVRAFLATKVASLTIAGDGREALARAEEEAFDLVLMDKQMPHMDGAEATRAIRALGGAWARTPIVAVTADAFQGAMDEMTAAGCQAFVAKPLSEGQLLETIEAVMTGRPAVPMTVAA